MTDNPPAPAAPPGWYTDPTGAQHWWNGQQWADHTQPAPQPTSTMQPQYAPPPTTVPPAKKNFWGWNPPGAIDPTAPYSGKAITGFVLVMAAILLGLTRYLAILALPLDIAGLIVAYTAMKDIHTTRQRGYGLAYAGYLTAALAIIIPIAIGLLALIGFAIFRAGS